MIKEIKIKTDLFDNSKVLRLENTVGDKGLACLFRLWIYAAKSKRNGVLSMSELINFCKCDKKVINIMVTIGFLDYKYENDQYCIHDWASHNFWVVNADRRSAIAKKNVDKRWDRKRLKNKGALAQQENANILNIDSQPVEPQVVVEAEDVVVNAVKLNNSKEQIECVPGFKEYKEIDRLEKLEAFDKSTELKSLPLPKSTREQEFEDKPGFGQNPSQEKVTAKEKIPYTEIMDYFNQVTGKNFRASSNITKKYIHARWSEGFKLDDFKEVIDIMASKWLSDRKFNDYLRPQTIFSNKFESYLNAKKKDNRFSDKEAETLDTIKSWYDKRQERKKRFNEGGVGL